MDLTQQNVAKKNQSDYSIDYINIKKLLIVWVNAYLSDPGGFF